MLFRSSGFGAALDALEENPLPHALVVRPTGDSREQIEALADDLAELDETDLVQVDTAWVERMRAMLLLVARAVDLATVLLALAVVLVIGNTIRLEINNRRTEIEVVKLVGGSDAFIRRPFLYMGLCYGLSGGLLAMLTIVLSLFALAGPTRALAGLYGSSFELQGLTPQQALLLLGAGAVLGAGVRFQRAVVWDGELVPAGLRAENGVFAGGAFHPVQGKVRR